MLKVPKHEISGRKFFVKVPCKRLRASDFGTEILFGLFLFDSDIPGFVKLRIISIR